jgi:hypothetical protein
VIVTNPPPDDMPDEPPTYTTNKLTVTNWVTFQWFFEDVALPTQTNSALVLHRLQETNAGGYRVEAAVFDSVQVSRTLQVEVLPWSPRLRIAQPAGRPVSWGNNSFGQTNTPASVAEDPARAVAGGLAHSVLVDPKGEVRAWGTNDLGQIQIPAGLTNVVGLASGAAHTLAVMTDVLRRYDVDAVHIDDYFYPYPVTREGAEVPFPDEAAWSRYRAEGGSLGREDWRRANVDNLVQAMYREVHRIKPHVRVGISPFGIGRPDRRPPGIQGFSQYDKLYADVERWLQEGWLDYLVPQLYWAIDRPAQAFGVLLDYWLAQNTRARHMWAGLYTSRVGAPESARAWPAREVIDQVALTRTRAAATGHVHFSMVALMQDREGLATSLQQGAYAEPALVPATPWLGSERPAAPRLSRAGAAPGVRAGAGPGSVPVAWAVWQRVQGRWRFAVQPVRARDAMSVLALEEPLQGLAPDAQAVVVSAVDRLGHESARVRLGAA